MIEGGSSKENPSPTNVPYPTVQFVESLGSGPTAASAEITAPNTGEIEEVSKPALPESSIDILVSSALRAADGAAADQALHDKRAGAVGEKLEALQQEYDTEKYNADRANTRYYDALRTGRARFWVGAAKSEGPTGRYVHGSHNIEHAIALSPPDDEPETKELRAERVQAALTVGEQIHEGAVVVMKHVDEDGWTVLNAAVSAHDGLSVRENSRAGGTRFIVGVNGAGMPMENAWKIEQQEQDPTAPEPVERIAVVPNFELATGPQAAEAVQGNFVELVNKLGVINWKITENSRVPDSRRRESNEALMDDRLLAADKLVETIEASEVVQRPLETNDDTGIAVLYLRDYLMDTGDRPGGPTVTAAATRIGKAMRTFYEAGAEGDAAMIEDLVAGASDRRANLRPTARYKQRVLAVIEQVCGAGREKVPGHMYILENM